MREIFRLTAVTKFSAGDCAISVPELLVTVAMQRFHLTALKKNDNSSTVVHRS
jgi:hypothetical protein